MSAWWHAQEMTPKLFCIIRCKLKNRISCEILCRSAGGCKHASPQGATPSKPSSSLGAEGDELDITEREPLSGVSG